MIKNSLLISLLSSATLCLNAQDTIPVLKGKMNVSITRGTIECDFILSNIPKIKNYYLRLNSGMNIRHIKNPSGISYLPYNKSLNDSLATGEANAYYIGAYNEFNKYLPPALELSYVGMFPVIADTSSAEDWKGNIAFNGKSLRTDGSQSAWYPVLYDIQKDRMFDKLSYDIEINCNDCKTLYINGSLPVEGTHARFTSKHPQELALFLGDFRVLNAKGTYLLNADMNDTQLNAFEQTVTQYKNYLADKTGVPYNGKPVYIQTTPVAKNYGWLFNSYPTIMNIGFGEDDLSAFAEKKKPYMAHELGHYYFGSNRAFNSELGDMLSEGFSEFMSMHIVRKLNSDSLFNTRIRSKLRFLNNFKGVPFASIRSENDYRNREMYVYYYAPLIFTAIEKEIGEENMWKWINTLLTTPAGFTNYQFLQQTLAATLNNKEKLAAITAKYFTTDQALDNAAATLGIPPNEETQTKSISGASTPKTYYYFIFARPLVDLGSPQNRSVKHTGVRQITCLPEERFTLLTPLALRLKAACENEGGCSLDTNTYDTPEIANAALQRWLKRWVDNPGYVIEVLK